jgi:hypothetical protein
MHYPNNFALYSIQRLEKMHFRNNFALYFATIHISDNWNPQRLAFQPNAEREMKLLAILFYTLESNPISHIR